MSTNENKEKEIENKKRPFYLAFRPNEFALEWNVDSPILSRIGFMHDDLDHPFVNQVKINARKNNLRILHITSDSKPINFDDEDVLNLLEFELLATEDGLNELEEMRLNWVQLYLKLISYINNKDRATFIPQMKYYSSQEGPLAGYLRGIDSMADSPDKELILSHIEKLLAVKWGVVYNEEKLITDFIYEIKGVDSKERLESFFIGAWCVLNVHYSRDFNSEDTVKLLTLIQFGKDLIHKDLDPIARDIIDEVVKLLVRLTLISLDNLLISPKHSLFMQSPLLFPNHYPQVSHMFYGIEKTDDFDLRSMIPDLVPFKQNEAVYRSKVVVENQDFVKKVFYAIEN